MSNSQVAEEFRVGSSGVCNIVMLKGITAKTTSTGSKMYSFTVLGQGGISASGVSFGDSCAYIDRLGGATDVVVMAVYNVTDYNGSPSVKLNSIETIYELSDEVSAQFMAGLDVAPIKAEILELFRRNTSESAVSILSKVFEGEGTELDRAMASQYGGIHDGVLGGLYNHIRKVVTYMHVASRELRVDLSQTEVDLLFLGIALHDIGKLLELSNGSYSDISIVPHTVLGLEVLGKYRDIIVEVYGEMFYRELQAIIVEHHGEYGERPKTVYAYIIHVVDLLDSRVSGLQKKMREADSARVIRFDDYQLRFNRYG